MPVNDYNFLVGTVVGFHALGGEVKVRPSTNNPELLLALKTVYVQPASSGQKSSGKAGKQDAVESQNPSSMKVRSVRMDRKMLLLAFSGLPDRTSVEHLEGANIYCRESDLLPLEGDEFWVKDLVGLEVYTTAGEFVGSVVSIIYGGNDLIEVQRPTDPTGRTVLIPFVQDLVPTVDVKKKRIEVVDVPGLLEAQ